MKWKIIGCIVLVLSVITVAILVLAKGNPFASNLSINESELPDGGGLITIDQLPQPIPPAAEVEGKVVTSPNIEPDVQGQDNGLMSDLIAPPVATPEGDN